MAENTVLAIQVTPEGMAIDAARNPAPMLRAVVTCISRELFNLPTLLRCAVAEVEAIGTERDSDPDDLTDAGGPRRSWPSAATGCAPCFS